MDLQIDRVDVWAAPIADTPGGLATLLAKLKEAGTNLEFIIARRSPDQPGKGVVFVTPLSGEKQVAAATALGFHATESVQSVRIEGPDAPGLGAALTAKLAATGLSLRGLSAATIGGRFVMYLGLDSAEDAETAVGVLLDV